MDEYFPTHEALCKAHAEAMATKNKAEIERTEKALAEHQKQFFVW